MCGIVGALSLTNSSFKITERYVTAMRDTMIHRGPDGCGTWISDDKEVGFGHRRLSIIDLSEAAAQPMCNADRSLWLTFNGEIYNHAEIRSELVKDGFNQWKTDHSDTEVILHAYERWGIEAIHKFRGMFAFGLWDNRNKELYLARDRIGIKPLYYSIHHGRLTFASEIKALLEDPEQPRAVCEEALYHYLSFLTTPGPQTLFEGIHKLAPGTWLRIKSNGTVKEYKYWDVLDHTQPLTNVSEEEISERVLEELRTAVQLRKVSDVPIGVFLSGGIDSSTNAALFSEGESRPINTFSIGYRGEYESYQNELHFARSMAKKVGAVYHDRLLTQDDLIDFLPQMVHLQDEPIADPVCVPVYYVSKLARDNGVTVCQVGEGADELFWGYPNWKLLLELQYKNSWPVPTSLKKLGLAGLRMLGREKTLYYEWLRRGANKLPVFWGGAEAFTEAQKRNLLSDRLKNKFKNFSSWEAIKPTYDRFRQKAWEQKPLQWMSYMDLNMRLPELLLMRVDKMSMGASLESRVPFLDHKFVELAMSIPENIKTRNGNLKYILKKSVRGLIPDELIDRKKQGFGVPIHEWFLDQLGTRVSRELVEFSEKTDLFNCAAVKEIMNNRKTPLAWYLFNLALWWKKHFN
ncbi:MAG: asparagine synthase (glutamine-hydrolyzing) [Nitrospinota bacterium]|nr:asparagine synthase (glutamine-hydrolyzing) [Nitrospinota bacterium]